MSALEVAQTSTESPAISPLPVAVSSPCSESSSGNEVQTMPTILPLQVPEEMSTFTGVPLPVVVTSLDVVPDNAMSGLKDHRTTEMVTITPSANNRRATAKFAVCGSNDVSDGEVSTGVVKWSKEATLRLIQLYREHQALLNDHHYKKKTIWEMIATKLTKESEKTDGMAYSWAHVGNRWKNLTKMYRDCIEMNHNVGRSSDVLHKCQFFDEISSVYKYGSHDSCDDTSKSKHVSGISCHSNQEILVVATKSNLKRINYVHIAPKQSAESTESSGNNSVPKETLTAKKCKLHTTPVASPSSADDVLAAIRLCNDNRKIQEDMLLERLDRMHKEKMEMFQQYLEIFKQYKKS